MDTAVLRPAATDSLPLSLTAFGQVQHTTAPTAHLLPAPDTGVLPVQHRPARPAPQPPRGALAAPASNAPAGQIDLVLIAAVAMFTAAVAALIARAGHRPS